MSFGRPPTFSDFRPKPPEKGSFPLDHEGECQAGMLAYLECLKRNKSEGLPCRELSKSYLLCRMERGLMAREELRRLGFNEASTSESGGSAATPSSVGDPVASLSGQRPATGTKEQ